MKNCLIFFTLFLGISCSKQQPFILISKDSAQRIHNWLQKEDARIITREFYYIPIDSFAYYLNKADGMVLGGGEDVNPIRYNKPEYDSICEAYDLYRDSIEYLMIAFAMQNKIPVMGICRGQQILNVACGGTLIPDIPVFKPNSQLNHRIKTTYAHHVVAEKNGWLHAYFNVDTFPVNSRHHQSVDKLAPGFTVAAYATDSIVESIRFADTLGHPFAVGVQWHPEGLDDNLSKNIARVFLQKVKLNSYKKLENESQK